MIEPQVAVEKLNSMTVDEILAEANSLECFHKQGDAEKCIIANILRHWTGYKDIGVSDIGGVRFGPVLEEGSFILKISHHIIHFIRQFDRGIIAT